MSSSSKETLKNHLDFRIGALVNDARTFLWSKCKFGSNFFNKDEAKGGGNFLITLGVFACLNLLAKIYWILVKSPDAYPLINKELKNELKSQREELEKILEDRKEKFSLFFNYGSTYLREGYIIIERDAFYLLISELHRDKKEGIDLGLQDDKRLIDKAWDDLRNALSHIGAPQIKVAAMSPDFVEEKTFADCLKELEKITPFIIKDDEVIVIIDSLNEYLPKILKWIYKKLDDSSITGDKIKACLELLKV